MTIAVNVQSEAPAELDEFEQLAAGDRPALLVNLAVAVGAAISIVAILGSVAL